MGSTVLYWTSSHADHELVLELLHLTNLFEDCSGRHGDSVEKTALLMTMSAIPDSLMY